MFTDGPLTPLRLESTIEVLRDNISKEVSRETLRKLLQPLSLPAVSEASWKSMTDGAIRAAEELGLVRSDRSIELTDAARGRRSVRECILNALDLKVLSATDVEWYFALFYSYLLGLGSQATGKSSDEWVDSFRRDVPEQHGEANPFNKVKLTGLFRWFSYVGLGWWDSSDNFVCNPYERLRRRLPDIFGEARTLDDHVFFDHLALACPELDGGAIFGLANPSYDVRAKQVSPGVAQAMLEMHEEQILKLHAFPDSGGWSLRTASPSDDGKTLRSDRLAQVEWIEKRRAT